MKAIIIALNYLLFHSAGSVTASVAAQKRSRAIPWVSPPRLNMRNV